MPLVKAFSTGVFSLIWCLASCSSTDSATDPIVDPNPEIPNDSPQITTLPDSLVGSWFICEFSDPSDCDIFDDDGIYLSANGEIFVIEEATQGSLDQCGDSPCFDSSVASIKIVRSQPIGTYSYHQADGILSLSIDGCDEDAELIVINDIPSLSLNNCDDAFDDSLLSDGSVLQIYTGQSSFEEEPILPNVIVGYWFICEFTNPENCRIFDDDGIFLSSNGEVSVIEETTQGSLELCGNSPCFDSFATNIQVVRNQSIGTYNYQPLAGIVSLSINGCIEDAVLSLVSEIPTLSLTNCDDAFDDSVQSNGSVLQMYSGQVDLASI